MEGGEGDRTLGMFVGLGWVERGRCSGLCLHLQRGGRRFQSPLINKGGLVRCWRDCFRLLGVRRGLGVCGGEVDSLGLHEGECAVAAPQAPLQLHPSPPPLPLPPSLALPPS